MGKYIIIALLGIAVGFGIAYLLKPKETIIKTEVRTEIIRDTIVNTIERVITKPVVTTQVKEITLPAEVIRLSDTVYQQVFVDRTDSIKLDLPIKIYQDSIAVGKYGLKYRHNVAGFLETSDYKIFGVQENKVTTIKETKVKKRWVDLYLGASFGDQVTAPGASVVFDRFMLDYHYNTIDQGHTFGAKIKLFSF